MPEMALVPMFITRKWNCDCWVLSVPPETNCTFKFPLGVGVMVGVLVFVAVGVKVFVGQFTQVVGVTVGVLVGPASIGAFQSLDSMVSCVWSQAPHVPQPPGFVLGS